LLSEVFRKSIPSIRAAVAAAGIDASRIPSKSQVAISLVLLIAAGLLLRALHRMAQVDSDFATDHRMYVRLFTPESDFTHESSTTLVSRLLEEAGRLPGVREATLSFAVLGLWTTSA